MTSRDASFRDALDDRTVRFPRSFRCWTLESPFARSRCSPSPIPLSLPGWSICLRRIDPEEGMNVFRIHRAFMFRDMDCLPDKAWKMITKSAKKGYLPDWIEEELDLAEFHALKWLLEKKEEEEDGQEREETQGDNLSVGHVLICYRLFHGGETATQETVRQWVQDMEFNREQLCNLSVAILKAQNEGWLRFKNRKP